MKVVFLVPTELPVPAVLGGAIENLVTALLWQNEEKKKAKFVVFSKYYPKAVRLARKIHFTKFVFWGRNAKWQKFMNQVVLEFLRRVYCHVYHVNEVTGLLTLNYTQLSMFMLIRREKPDCIIVEGGDYESYFWLAKYFGAEKMCLHLHHEFCSWPRVDETFGKIIVVSEFAKQRFLSTSEKAANMVKVLYNCANESTFTKRITKQERIGLRRKLGFSENDFVVLFCGRIIPEKGIKELLNAVKQIKDKKVKLLIVGSVNFKLNGNSEYYQDIVRQIEDNQECIKFTGFVDNELLYQYYQIADVQAVPSIWQEVAGIVTIEGMYSGLPLIITHSGGMTEYVDESCACIIEQGVGLEEKLAEKILYLYEHEDVRKRMGKAALENATKFSKEKFYNNFMECIRGE